MENYINRSVLKSAPDTAKKYDIYMHGNAYDLRKKIVDSIKDDTYRMSRAFPTFKLFFVEEDMEQWNLMDDFYGYNSIESIQIHKSKENAADTAVIRMTNFLGHLDNKSFESDSHSFTKKEKIEEDTLEEYQPEFQDTYLYPGTRIKIKIGYSSNENELDNVFTGKITEVEHGDIVTIIAQGFGVELLHPKGYDWGKSKYGWFKSDPLSIMNMLVSQPECKHLGRWGFNNLEYGQMLGRRVKGHWVKFFNKPQDDNIFIEDSKRSSTVARAIGFFNEYRIYKTTSWGVFQDMRRRFPGYATAVVPYDNRATLFFGLPNQFYNWTSGRNDVEINDQTEDTRRLERDQYKPMSQAEDAVELDIPDEVTGPTDSTIWGEKARLKLDTLAKKAMDGNLEKEEAEIMIETIETLSDTSDATLMSKFKEELRNNPKKINELFSINTDKGDGDTVFAQGAYGAQTINIPKYRCITIAPRDKVDEHESGYKSNSNNLWKSKSLGDILSQDEIDTKYPLATSPDKKYKPFRSYHWKDSFHHIIANRIKINLENFYNRVIVHFYGDIGGRSEVSQQNARSSFVTVMADDGIPDEFWRTKVVYECNAERGYQARNYALGNLLQTMAELYTGELTIMGDASIKPYDYVYINDMYTDMYGPIEVKEVVHNFSLETGFVTTIIPHLVCHVNSPTQILDTFETQSIAAIVGVGAIVAVFSLIASPLIAGVVVVGGLCVPIVKDTFFPILFGRIGFKQHTREPVGITPLIYNGKPYIAGFEGMEPTGWISYWEGRLQTLKKETIGGIKAAKVFVQRVFNSLKE